MYRIPKDQIPCKFDHAYSEVIGEKWMGSCPMWECLWFEQSPDDPAKAEEIESHLNKFGGDKCTTECAGFTPVETRICPAHDEEFVEECGSCMRDFTKKEEEGGFGFGK